MVAPLSRTQRRHLLVCILMTPLVVFLIHWILSHWSCGSLGGVMNDVGSCVQEGDEQLATEILPRLEFVIVNTVFCYGLAGLALLLRGRLRFFTEPKVSHKAKRITLFVLVFINVTLCVLASADSEFLFLTVTLFFGLITTEESYICSLILFSLLFYGLLVGISSTSYRGMVTLVVLNIAAYCTPMYIFLHYMQRLGV